MAPTKRLTEWMDTEVLVFHLSKTVHAESRLQTPLSQ